MNLNAVEASVYLKDKWGVELRARTLANMRSNGGGPRYRRDGKRAVYSTVDLDAYATYRLGTPVEHTAQERAAGRSFNSMDAARAGRRVNRSGAA